ncbi:MAG: hypothetical protein N3I86_11025 [Verrucomicrobiae bacterium]|nr:hypothetical protein [Verrucomicrobiae bacterium]
MNTEQERFAWCERLYRAKAAELILYGRKLNPSLARFRSGPFLSFSSEIELILDERFFLPLSVSVTPWTDITRLHRAMLCQKRRCGSIPCVHASFTASKLETQSGN